MAVNEESHCLSLQAVKEFNVKARSRSSREQDILLQIDHENVVKLIDREEEVRTNLLFFRINFFP